MKEFTLELISAGVIKATPRLDTQSSSEALLSLYKKASSIVTGRWGIIFDRQDSDCELDEESAKQLDAHPTLARIAILVAQHDWLAMHDLIRRQEGLKSSGVEIKPFYDIASATTWLQNQIGQP